MAVKEYILSKLGRNHKVSEHFTLGEFVSPKDKVDIVKIDDRLLDMLEILRAVLGGDGIATVGITSGYRSPAYNRSIGGASQSRHTYGDAADVVCKQNGKRISGKLICCLCQDLGFTGVALNKGSGYSVHLDMRPSGTYRGDERYGYDNNVGGDFYSYFGIKKSQVDALKMEEEEMTQEQFNQMMNVWISQQAEKQPSGWSEAARTWAQTNKIINGDSNGYSYLTYCTREQMVQFLYNFYNNIVSKMGGGSSDAVLQAMIDALNGLKK